MPNMSYCRFENTARAMADCISAIEDNEVSENLSIYEVNGLKDMQMLAMDLINLESEIEDLLTKSRAEHKDMIKIKTIYDELKPEYKTELNANARKYSSAKRLKYTLMSKTIWQDLTMSEVSTMTTYCDVLTYKFSAQDIMYGKAFLKD